MSAETIPGARPDANQKLVNDLRRIVELLDPGEQPPGAFICWTARACVVTDMSPDALLTPALWRRIPEDYRRHVEKILGLPAVVRRRRKHAGALP